MNNNIDIESHFKLSGKLTRRKIIEYFPAMMITNLSTLLLVSVDGLVVGNLLGENALSSVSIFGPAELFLGVISAVVAYGASARVSVGMGKIDLEGLHITRSTLKRLVVIAAVFSAVIQIPIVWLIISSYHLSPEMNHMVWSYAIGMMIASPFGLISSFGVYQFQIIGKMKPLMWMAVMEGVINLLLDLLFVGPLHMGVAGAGFGTAGANLVRCTVTVIYLWKKTDLFYSGDAKPSWKEAGAIISQGLPDAAHLLMMTVQSYTIIAILLSLFGEAGGTIKGVCSFSASLAGVFAGGIQGSLRPMIGLMTGAKSLKGLRLLMKQGIIMNIALLGVVTILFELFPQVLYSINGVKTIPDGGITSLRFFVLHLIFTGLCALFRIYYSNRKIIRFCTILTIAGNAMLPLFAFILSRLFPAPYVWLCYLFTDVVILIAYVVRYLILQHQDREELEQSETVFYLTVSPEQSIEASREIRAYADANGLNKKHAFRLALCMEEMLAYAKKSKGREDVNVQVVIRFLEDKAVLMILDDGQCIFLDKEEKKHKLITTNYGLLKKLSKTVEYQYVLNMNYTVCTY